MKFRTSLNGKIMLRFIMCLTLLISAQAAGAQDQSPASVPPPFAGGSVVPPTDLQSGIGNYCIYENLVYSIGSPICIGKTSYICLPSTNDTDFNKRAYWAARSDNPRLLVAPGCQWVGSQSPPN
jgi:hypothetical protein